jgi:hypothetical protein
MTDGIFSFCGAHDFIVVIRVTLLDSNKICSPGRELAMQEYVALFTPSDTIARRRKPEFPKLEDIIATAWAWHKKHSDGYPD